MLSFSLSVCVYVCVCTRVMPSVLYTSAQPSFHFSSIFLCAVEILSGSLVPLASDGSVRVCCE